MSCRGCCGGACCHSWELLAHGDNTGFVTVAGGQEETLVTVDTHALFAYPRPEAVLPAPPAGIGAALQLRGWINLNATSAAGNVLLRIYEAAGDDPGDPWMVHEVYISRADNDHAMPFEWTTGGRIAIVAIANPTLDEARVNLNLMARAIP